MLLLLLGLHKHDDSLNLLEFSSYLRNRKIGEGDGDELEQERERERAEDAVVVVVVLRLLLEETVIEGEKEGRSGERYEKG